MSATVPAKRGKTPRQKHIPQRMCVVCRDKSAKRELFRIVRTNQGEVQLDPTGRLNGRGAYLCSDLACWQKALSGSLLDKALNVQLSDSARSELSGFASKLPPVTDKANTVSEESGKD